MSDEEYLIALKRGHRLNQYEILSVLGAGGFGITYLAQDTTLDKLVAIKEYLPSDFALRATDSKVTAKSTSTANDFQWGLARFLEEARILAKFRHPHIVEVYQIFESNATAYIVMGYAEGETLAAKLQRDGPMSEADVKAVLLPILDGLQKVHALGFLHRDVKPGNIIIRKEEGAVLIDFGAARQAVGAKSRSITSIVTEGYAPIEQYSSTGDQGTWTDIYAMGAVAYKCLTGDTPPSATMRLRTDPMQPAVEAAAGHASPAFLAAIDWALSPHETDRPQTIAEWLPALQGKASANAERTRRADKKPDNPRPKSDRTVLNPSASATDLPQVPPIQMPQMQMPQVKMPRQMVAGLGGAAAVAVVGFAVWWFLLGGAVPKEDRDAWNAAVASNSAAGYQAYMRVEPDGHYFSQAKEKIGSITAIGEGIAWLRASNQKTVEGYQTYLADYPEGQHVDAARNGIKAALHAAFVMQVQQGLTTAGFYKGPIDGQESTDTIAAAHAFWTSLGGLVSDAIDERLLAALNERNAAIIRQQQEAQAQAARQQQEAVAHERNAYTKARLLRSRTQYEAFLAAYPTDQYADDVRARLAQCKTQQVSENVPESSSISAQGTGQGQGQAACAYAVQNARNALTTRCQSGRLTSITVASQQLNNGGAIASGVINLGIGIITKRNPNINVNSSCTAQVNGVCETSRMVNHSKEVCP